MFVWGSPVMKLELEGLGNSASSGSHCTCATMTYEDRIEQASSIKQTKEYP